jgi:4'-phosphopantetheinyl transferase
MTAWMSATASSPRERLADRECHVWVVRVDEALAAGEDRYLPWLTEEEKERVGRYRFDRHRREHFATRVLARAALSRYTGVPPEGWVFGAGSYGKPHVVRPATTLAFNLANTEGLVVCAVAAGGEVGVDVEPIVGRGDPMELAETAFSADEVAGLRATPPAERRARFVALWTLKEAYLKARGVGLSLATDRFSVAVDGDSGARISFDPAVADRPGRWQLVRITSIAGYQLAVALLRGDGGEGGDGGERRVLVRTSPTLDIHQPSARDG